MYKLNIIHVMSINYVTINYIKIIYLVHKLCDYKLHNNHLNVHIYKHTLQVQSNLVNNFEQYRESRVKCESKFEIPTTVYVS